MNLNRVQLWSCGFGRQSVLILGLVKLGILPRPDHVCGIDTNRERSSSWRYVEAVFKPELAQLGIPFTIIDRSKYATVDLVGGEFEDSILLPAYSSRTVGGGKLPEFCSDHWKKRPVMRWAANQGGWKERGVDCWLGISADEKNRRRGQSTQWFRPVYPLLDMSPSHVSRVYTICEQMGWPEPPRSSCWMCPNHTNDEWSEIKETDPDDFAKACELEKEVQQIDPDVWLHKSRVPLAMADLSVKSGQRGGGCTSGMCY